MGSRSYTDIEILKMFVIRGRRIRAHSLMADDAGLLRSLARSSVNVVIGLENESLFTTPLPPEEEQFESLAARIRPFILASEPVHREKVLGAVCRLLAEAHGVTAAMRQDLDRLADRWARVDPENGELQAWSMWISKADGTGPQHEVTDSVLALGWLYSDLVHVELRKDRAVAAEFPMSQRYLAASQVLSRVALAAVDTLAFVKALNDAGILDLPESLWTEDVVAPEVMEATGRLYLGQPGVELSDGAAPMHLNDSFSLASVTSMSRVQGRRADILFLDESGEELERHDGAVIDISVDGDARTLTVLVENSVRIDIYVETDHDGKAAGAAQVNGEIVAKTNRALRAYYNHIVKAARADRVVLAVEDLGVFTMPKVEPSTATVAVATVYTCLLDDFIAIEDITGRSLQMLCAATLSPRDLTEARRVRLLMEGKLLTSGSSYLRVPAEEQPPADVPVVIPAAEASAAGVELPALRVALFSSNTTVCRADEPDEQAGTLTWLIETTDGTPFLMASIDHAVGDDEEIAGPVAEIGLADVLALFYQASKSE